MPRQQPPEELGLQTDLAGPPRVRWEHGTDAQDVAAIYGVSLSWNDNYCARVVSEDLSEYPVRTMLRMHSGSAEQS
jgi:hypothetical protein